MKLRCLIIDDEQLALDILEDYISRLDRLELIGRCQNAIEAFNILQQEQVDLIFVDIQMPRLTGIDLVKNLPHPPKVIFTTAYREYALDSYELNALDYLLKPISFDRFLRAVNKAIPQVTSLSNAVPIVHAIPSEQDAFVYLKSDKKMVKVFLKDILYIESLAAYVQVHTTDRKITCYKKISEFEEKLPQDQFLRVHRSFLVATRHIAAYTSAHIEIDDQEIPIGRNFKNEVLKALKNIGSLEI